MRAGEQVKSRERISVLVLVCPDVLLCRILGMSFSEAGYAVIEAATYADVRSQLRAASRPMVVVAGHAALDFRAEVDFFAQVAADAALAQHRYVLLSTAADWLPDELGATLHSLGVLVVAMPSRLEVLLAAVARASGRVRTQTQTQTQTQTEDTPTK